MKIEKISYQKAFVIGPYLQDRVGVEIALEEGDSMEGVLDCAKKYIENWHKTAHPDLSATNTGLSQEPVTIQMEKPSTENRIAMLAADILSCTELKVLESYKLMVKSSEYLQATYDQQYKKLTEE